MALAQNREPSFLTCQPSIPKWPSAADRFSSFCGSRRSLVAWVEQRQRTCREPRPLGSRRSRSAPEYQPPYVPPHPAEKRVILHRRYRPIGEVERRTLVAQDQNVADRQHVALGCILNLPQLPSGPASRSVPSCCPVLRNVRHSSEMRGLDSGSAKSSMPRPMISSRVTPNSLPAPVLASR